MSYYETDSRVSTKRDWALPLGIACLSLVVSAYSGYTNDSKRNAERITTVEVQQKNDAATLLRLEAKIDEANAKLDAVLQRPTVTLPPGWSYRDPNPRR